METKIAGMVLVVNVNPILLRNHFCKGDYYVNY